MISKSRGLSGAFALDGQLDLGALLAQDLLDGVAHDQPLGRDHLRPARDRLAFLVHFAGDGRDQVAGLEAGLVGRAALDRRHHQQEVGGGVLADLDADAGEVALHVDLEAIERFRVDVGGIGVERLQHLDQADVDVLVLVEVFPLAQGGAGVDQQLAQGLLVHGP